MKLPVYPIGSFYFIRGKLSSIRSGTTPTSGQSSKEPQFANLLLRNAPLKPDPDMEKRLNEPLIQYYIKFILPKFWVMMPKLVGIILEQMTRIV